MPKQIERFLDLSNTNNKINSVSGDLDTAEENITTLETDLDTVSGDLDTLENDINNLSASNIETNTTNFDNNLTSADDTVQKALNKLDNLTITSGDTDEHVKVSSNDTTAGYLNDKIIIGTGITIIENNDGGNETLSIGTSGLASQTDLDTVSGDLDTAEENITDLQTDLDTVSGDLDILETKVDTITANDENKYLRKDQNDATSYSICADTFESIGDISAGNDIYCVNGDIIFQ